MSIDQLVAVVPVSDMNTAMPWYELLVGRPPDNHPMETLVEWRITDTGWIQVFHDPERAGSTLLNFAVDDLDRQVAEVTDRGLSLGDIQSANQGGPDYVRRPGSDLVLEPGANSGPGLGEWLDALDQPSVKAAVFDTRFKAPAVLTGRASKGIEKKLSSHGLMMVVTPESFLVNKKNHLLPGEIER